MAYVNARGATLQMTDANTYVEQATEQHFAQSIAQLADAYDNLNHLAAWDFFYGVGNGRDNIIQMGAAPNALSGGAGNDVLIGGGGNDVFIVRANEGSDLIQDFSGSLGDGDKVRLAGFHFYDFAQVQGAMTNVANSASPGGWDVQLDLGSGEILVFHGHVKTDFRADDFQYDLDRDRYASGPTSFADDFNDLLGLSQTGASTKWATTYPNQTGDAAHWIPWNGELQYYAGVEDGAASPFSITDIPNEAGNKGLTITVDRTPSGFDAHGQAYVSGLIDTYNGFEQQYGYFEMRANLPSGNGLWPAFWLLPKGDWPSELDVMEVLGKDSNVTYTTWHSETHSEPDTSATQGPHTSEGIASYVGDLHTGQHTFGVLWGPDVTVWYVDNAEVFRSSTPIDLHEKMYLIANLAVSSAWGGRPDASTPFPSTMTVDYIKAWTLPTATYSNTISGTAGADTLEGKMGTEQLVGGAGDDVYVLTGVGDHIVEAAGGGRDTVQIDVSYALAPEGASEVENVVLQQAPGAIYAAGNGLDNELTGNGNNNTLWGMMGADTLHGGAGSDTLGGGAGDDVLDGGDGRDLASFDAAAAAVSVDLGAGRATGDGSDTLVGIERVLGSSLNDTLVGGDGDDELDGGWGADVLRGGDGNDTLVATLMNDSLDGGAGNDLVQLDDAAARYAFASNADGSVTMTHTLADNTVKHVDILTSVETARFADGSTLDLRGYYGGSQPPPTGGQVINGNDTPSTWQGTAGDDTITAGTGNDTLVGGGGADTFAFRNLAWSHSEVTDFTPSVDRIDLSRLFSEHAPNYTGTDPVGDGYLSFSDDGAGNLKIYFDPDGPSSNANWPFFITQINHTTLAQANPTLIYPGHGATGGGAPGDVINGTDSPAPLHGTAGDDTITAGSGNDTLTGGDGADTFAFRNLAWSHSEVTDFTPSVDRIDLSRLFSEHAPNYTGTDPVGDGYLSFSDDGAGNLKIYFDPDGPSSNANWPFFITQIDHTTLAQANPTLIYPGHGATGGGVPGDVINGTDTPAPLHGTAGDDTITAGSGNDTLTGGDGADRFAFHNLAWSHSVVTDFHSGQDVIDLRGLFTDHAPGYVGTDPLTDGYLSLQDDGAGGTAIYFDPDGPSSNANWPFYITDIQGVAPANLSPNHDWIWH